jgi:integrase
MAIDRAKYMGRDETKQLRRAAEDRSVSDLQKGRIQGVLTWLLVDLALSTGLRVSEMAALQAQDVDVRRGALRVVRLKRRKKVGETIAIGKQLVQHLKGYLVSRADRVDTLPKSVRGILTASRGALFVGQRGALTSGGLQQIWKAAIKSAGLPRELSIHSARHTLAVRLLKKTGNLRQVQKQLGHASPTVTANMYADIAFEDMQEGLNGIYDDEETA